MAPRCAALLLASIGCAEPHRQPEPLERLPLPPGYGDGLSGRAFTSGDTHHTLADFQTVALHITFDVGTKTTTGHAEVRFRPVDNGVPVFLLTPVATSAALDGRPIQLGTVRDPDNVTTFTSIGVPLTASSDHVLVLDYPLSGATYSTTGVDFTTTMYDLDPLPQTGVMAQSANYFEAYGPAGIEADQFQMSVEVDLVGATSPHRLFSNGAQRSTAPGQWTVEFPDYFSTSSVFFQLSEAPYVVREMTYHGLDHDIPITVYASEMTAADDAITRLPDLFQDLETTFGPYPHASFTARITSDGGGMEHAGATITTIHALSHELCHSWFGRGVLPADGRSGWIDEAITTWRDVLYQRDSNFLTFPSTNLSNYSIWHKGAPGLPHLAGKDLLSGIDALMADQGGLLPIVRAFYTDWLHKPVTTEQFLSYLEARSGLSLATEIDKYVYGEGCHTDDFCQ